MIIHIVRNLVNSLMIWPVLYKSDRVGEGELGLAGSFYLPSRTPSKIIQNLAMACSTQSRYSRAVIETTPCYDYQIGACPGLMVFCFAPATNEIWAVLFGLN